MSHRLLIIGAGAQARYVIEAIAIAGERPPIGAIDTFENAECWGTEVDGVPVLGGGNYLARVFPESDLKLVLAVADNFKKQALARSLAERGFSFASIVHPRAIIARNVQLGLGCIVNAGVVIETGATIGDHVILHAGCVVEHDNVLGDFVNLAPGVITAGRVRIGRGATVFTGARIVPDIAIGADAVVGAGALVLEPVPAGTTVFGVPARLKQRPEAKQVT